MFVGGQFNEALVLGDIEISSIQSNNVYVAYLKDDTWLNNSYLNTTTFSVSPNPFKGSFSVNGLEELKSIEISNSIGELVLSISSPQSFVNIGSDWKTGVYIMNALTTKGERKIIKLVKIH